jgi:hypothetical protein
MPPWIYDSMQASVDDEKNKGYIVKRVNPVFDDVPIPTTDLQTSDRSKKVVRVQMKPLVRTDYRRVVCVMVALFGFICMSYVVYYHNIIHVSNSNSTDTSLHNFNQKEMGDVLIVSFQLQVQGATEPAGKSQADILIPLDSLRSNAHERVVLVRG